MTTRRFSLVAVAMLGGAMLAGGCEKTFTIRHFPEFCTPDLRTVVVVPFRNETSTARAGEVLADTLAGALKANGTYEVVGPRELRAKMGDKPYEALTAMDPKAAAAELKKLGNAQAMITGTVHAYNALGSERSMGPYQEQPGAVVGQYYPYLDMNHPVVEYEYVTQAYVEISAQMVRLSDAEVYCAPPAVEAVGAIRGFAPASRADAMRLAVSEAAHKVVAAFAVVPMDITVNPATDLRTAADGKDGAWRYADSFPATAERMYVVVALPAAADKNSFRITITPKGGPGEVLSKQDLVWSRAGKTAGTEFSPAKFAKGGGTYSANFYYSGQLIMSHDFRLD